MSERCPICRKKEAVKEFEPFCSKRCADVDLNRWLTGGYTIKTDERPDEMDAFKPANDQE